MNTPIHKFIKSWAIDLLIGLIALIIIYSTFNYQHLLSVWIEPLFNFLNISLHWFDDFWNQSYQIARQTITFSLLAKLSVLLVLLSAFVWRLIWRLRTVDAFTSTDCPRCGYPLSRIKRTNWQRAVSRVLPLRRFHCKKCRWTGVRLKPYKPLPLNVQEGAYRTYTQTQKIDAQK